MAVRWRMLMVYARVVYDIKRRFYRVVCAAGKTQRERITLPVSPSVKPESRRRLCFHQSVMDQSAPETAAPAKLYYYFKKFPFFRRAWK